MTLCKLFYSRPLYFIKSQQVNYYFKYSLSLHTRAKFKFRLFGKKIQLLKEFESKAYNLLPHNTYKLNKIKYNSIGLKETLIENRFSSNRAQLAPLGNTSLK